MRRWALIVVGAWLHATAAVAAPAATPDGGRHASLAVVIVVDQLREDQARSSGRRGQEGGFARFRDRGIVYSNAWYEHAFTLTAPGHATIFTGVHPSRHGIVANLWYSRAERRQVESVHDPEHRTFGTGKGQSPRLLRTETVGDHLMAATAGRSAVFAVSGKAHSAILPAGRRGKAYWYEPEAGGFTTSAYYHPELPAWVSAWNADAFGKSPASWQRCSPDGAAGKPDASDEFQRPPARMGRRFPHPLGPPGSRQSLDNLRYTPTLDELTLQFAMALVDRHGLGSDADPDLLAIGLSATDYIGHAFGPDSQEMRDNLARLDAALARFFDALDDAVDAGQYAVFLVSDHGVDSIPEYRATLGLPAHRLGMANIFRELNSRLRVQFGVDRDLIESFASPFIYLDFAAIEASGLDREQVISTVAGMLKSIPGVERAVRTDSSGLARADGMTPLIRNSIDAERSGELCVVPAAGTFLHDNAEKNAAMHGSPHEYDRHVPMMVYGAGLRPRVVARPVSPASIAATVAAYLGFPLPSDAASEALPEVMDDLRLP